jgi:type II secretory pathway component GspD/PulD (secretin)
VTKLAIPDIKIREFGFDKDEEIQGLGKLVFGTVARDGYEVLRYLETLGQAKIISNPRLLVTENQEAKIHVGTREAYITTTTTTGQTTSTTAEDVNFIDVGIQFSVTPTINQDGFVTLKVKPEVSSVVRTLTTPSENQIPIVDTSTAETTVMVADGTTVIIGGLRKDEKGYTNEQIPYLGHLPILGPLLFKQTNRDDQLTELVVFITPHISGGDKMITGDEAPKFRDYREYTPVIKDRFTEQLTGAKAR